MSPIKFVLAVGVKVLEDIDTPSFNEKKNTASVLRIPEKITIIIDIHIRIIIKTIINRCCGGTG